jgi:hypothetical protein
MATAVFHFNVPAKQIFSPHTLRLENVVLPFVVACKDLGYHYDNQFEFLKRYE